MRKELLVLLACWTAGLTSCQPNAASSPAETEVPGIYVSMDKPQPSLVKTSDSVARPVPASIQAEQIKAEMLVFKGLPSEQITVPQLIKQLGQPDSVARGVVECGSVLSGELTSPGDVWYYDGTQYEVADNQAVLSSMDVRSGRFSGKLGQLVLNQRTTLEDVARVFPRGAQTVRPAAESAALQQVSFTFLLANGETADGALWLIFDHGKLIRVTDWFPC